MKQAAAEPLPPHLLDLLRSSQGTPLEATAHNTALREMQLREMQHHEMQHSESLQRAHALLQKVKDPMISPTTRAAAVQHAQGVLSNKRASEMAKLAACLKDNKSWMPEGKKKKMAPTGMAGDEAYKTSELQNLATMLQKRAGVGNFFAKGLKQVRGAVTNPASLQEGVMKAYDKGGGGFGGAMRAAKKYAPGVAAVAAPMAAGALLHGAFSSNDDDRRKGASYIGPEMRKLAGMVGKGLGIAGRVAGALPTGVGNVLGAGLGAAGGALSAPRGMGIRGAVAGSFAGLPGGAGFIAPTIAGRALGVP